MVDETSGEYAPHPPAVGERAPDFEALLCDGETFRAATLSEVLTDRGCVLVFYAFTFSAVAENWWGRYDRRGWDDFPVPVVGVCRDGPYAQNAFFRSIDSPFRSFSDTAGGAIGAYGLLADRDGMDGAETARRAVYVLDGDRRVVDRWVMDDWISPIPADSVEETVHELRDTGPSS